MAKDTDDVPLREYIESQRKADREYLNLHVQALTDAVKVAKQTLDHRLEGMNEFRAQLDKQTQTFVTRPELLAVAGLIIAVATMIAKWMK